MGTLNKFSECNSGTHSIPQAQTANFGQLINVESGIIIFKFSDTKDQLANGWIKLTPINTSNNAYLYSCIVDGTIIEKNLTPQPYNCDNNN